MTRVPSGHGSEAPPNPADDSESSPGEQSHLARTHQALNSLPVRLDRFLREATALCLERSRELCRTDKLLHDHGGMSQRSPFEWDHLIFPGDQLHWDGVRLTRRAQHHSFALNKPAAVTSSIRDPDSTSDLSQFVSQLPAGVFPVGRLDRMTRGLLLFTTDSDLSNALLSPSFEVKRLYRAVVRGSLGSDDPRLFALVSGVDWPGHLGRLQAFGVQWLGRSDTSTTLEIVLTEGKKRELRRLCGAVGLPVQELERIGYGGIALGSLAPGALRELSPAEVRTLWAAVGGAERVLAERLEALRQRATRARHAGNPFSRLEAWLLDHARAPLPCPAERR